MTWWLGGEMGPSGILEWTSPDWVILVSVAAALLALGASLRGQRSIGARVGEATCLLLGVAGVVIALAGPVWVEEEGRTEPGRVAVLVDASRSMGVIEDGSPRSDNVAEILDGLDLSDAEVFHFGEELAVGRPTGFTAPGTDLEGALDALSERVAGEKLAGIAVISDGLDRGTLRRRFAEDPENAALPDVPGPLTLYQVGEATDLRDLAIRDVTVGGYAFLRTPFRVRARVEGVGFQNKKITATLLQDGATVSQTAVQLDETGAGEASFEVRPTRAGRFTYAVSVPVYEGDAVPANNVAPVVVKVVRDKIRVLQVAGAPSWDVKFLRRFLKGDPFVDLVSFFILRTMQDMTNEYGDDELSLIQFPYRDLFSTELGTFDIVIFQNYDYQPYFGYASSELLNNIRRYVEEDGGSLVMIGGDRSYGLGQYGRTPLASVLPLKINDGETPELKAFRPLLTEDGQRHPLTRLVSDPDENARWWERLPDLDGTNVTLGPTEDAAVLLSHPTRTTQTGDPLPILAVREAGKGRTMALTVDSSWRWSLTEAAEGRGNQAYLRFWKNAMRWLMADPALSRVSAETPRENYAVEDEVRIVVRARDPGFAPLQGATVEATVRGPGGEVTHTGRTGPDGEVVLVHRASTRGAHRVQVYVTAEDGPVGEANTVFAVTNRDPELDEVAPDRVFLETLAARTGGRYYPPGAAGPILRDPASGRTVFDRRETALWRAPLLALWSALFLGLAWIIRRRSGLR